MISSSITLNAVFCFAISVSVVKAELRTCALLGQQYPPPTAISAEPDFQSMTKSIEAMLESSIRGLPYNETTFSIGMFSTSEEDIAWQYHHATKLLSRSEHGAQTVDANSIYRIGSISKLLTMYLFLISEGDHRLSDPVTKYIPELQNAGHGRSDELIPNWSQITIGDLAGQMAGLARDYGLADVAVPSQGLLPPSLSKLLPNISQANIPRCGYLTAANTWVGCSAEEYIKGVASETPIFPTAYTPVYSNEAFAIIGIALSNIADAPFEQLFNDKLVKALNLSSTSYTVPSKFTKEDVIPISASVSNWNTDLGPFSPAGGYFSSTNDFAIIGKAILNSTLLTASQTRRWLKPTSFVSDFKQGVGRPWEIFRLKVNNHSVDFYTKAGDWGAYHTFFGLIPDYEFGFTIFTSPDPTSKAGSDVRDELPNLISEKILTALDGIAKKQAARNFAGTYCSKSTNSSVKLEMDNSSALRITQWTNNGSDILNDLFEAISPGIDFRLVPNQLYSGSKKGFTGFYQSPAPNRLFYGSCFNWVDVDELTYGSVPLGQVVFETDEHGKASAIELKALRIRLEKAT